MKTRLTEVYAIREAPPAGAPKKLGPEQERLVREFADTIWKDTVGFIDREVVKIPREKFTTVVFPIAQKIEAALRVLLVRSEAAEGEPASDVAGAGA